MQGDESAAYSGGTRGGMGAFEPSLRYNSSETAAVTAATLLPPPRPASPSPPLRAVFAEPPPLSAAPSALRAQGTPSAAHSRPPPTTPPTANPAAAAAAVRGVSSFGLSGAFAPPNILHERRAAAAMTELERRFSLAASV